MTTAIEYMQWVGKHLDWFEFHTSQARALRAEIRQWLYTSQDADEAQLLRERFQKMFSNNPVVDTVYAFFREEITRQFAIKRGTYLDQLPKCAVTGRTIRAYGGPEQMWKNPKMFSPHLQRLTGGCRKGMQEIAVMLQKASRSEEKWYRQQKIGVWTLLSVVCYLFGMASALLVMIQMIEAWIEFRTFDAAMLMRFPKSYWTMGKALWVMPAAALLSLILFCVKDKRMYYSGVAGLLWIKDIKRENKARKKFFDCLVQKIKDNGLEQLAVQQCAAAKAIAEKGGDFLEKDDASPQYMGHKGVRQLTQLPLPVVRPNREKREKFYAQLQKTGIVHPFWYFAAGVVLLVLVYGFMRDPAGILPVWRFLHGM